jgi:hypothetical protein
MTVDPVLTFQPGTDSVRALRLHWQWLLGERWTLRLCSVLGDVFLALPSGSVWWLSTATGGLEQVADTPEQFEQQLVGERHDEWFLPGLVAVLRAQGHALAPDQCYSFRVFPVFAEGSFSAENLYPLSAAVHFRESGQLHERLRQLPDGASVPVLIDV